MFEGVVVPCTSHSQSSMIIVAVDAMEVVFSPHSYVVPQVHQGGRDGSVETTMRLRLTEGFLQFQEGRDALGKRCSFMNNLLLVPCATPQGLGLPFVCVLCLGHVD